MHTRAQRENQRQGDLLRRGKLDLPHVGNGHQPDGEIGHDVDDGVADGELLEIKAGPLVCPERADRPAIEDGQEDHDDRPHGDKGDHGVDEAQESRMLEDAAVEEEQGQLHRRGSQHVEDLEEVEELGEDGDFLRWEDCSVLSEAIDSA